MATVWTTLKGVSSLGYKTQASYDVIASTTVADFTGLRCSAPSFTLDRKTEDLKLLSGTYGAATAAVVGAKSGQLTVKFPLFGQAAAWAKGDAPTVPPGMDLVAELIGSTLSGTAKIVGALTNGTANTWTTAELLTGRIGAAYATAVDATAGPIKSIGFVRRVNAGVAYITEDGTAAGANGDDLVSLVTAYSADAQPTPRSFCFVGLTAGQMLTFVGCMPTSGKINLAIGTTPTAEITYTFTDHKWGASNGPMTIASYAQIPPITGSVGGRFTLNGGSTGTADAEGTCGIGGLMLEVALSTYVHECHGGAQGVSDVEVLDRSYKLSGKIPHTSALMVTLEDGSEGTIFDESLCDGVAISALLVVGNQPGRMLAVHMPAGLVTSQAPITVDNEVIGHSFVLEAGVYAGDTDGTGVAKNTVCRLAFG